MQDLCVFAINRGDIESRIDVKNVFFNLNYIVAKTKTVSLGELCLEEPCYGTSATAIKRTDNTQPKYIRITDFDDLGIEDNHEYMTAESYAIKHILKPNDVLFARTGGTVGKTYFYDGKIDKAVFAGYCIRFSFDERKVVPKFVYWYTKTKTYQKWVNGIQRPSGQPNINKEEFKSFEIVLPSMQIQQKLVKFMDKCFSSYKEKLKHSKVLPARQKEKTLKSIGVSFEGYVPSLYSYSRLKNIQEIGIYCNSHSDYLNSVFHHLIKNDYYVGNLENFVEINPTTSRKELSHNSVVSFVPMTAVGEKNNEVVYEAKKYEEVKTGFTCFKKGDLLWAKITPCMQNGKSFLASEMPTDIGFGSTEFHILRQKSDRIYMPYLWVILSDEHILEAAQGMFGGSAGQQRIPDTFLKKFPIVLPPLQIQKELADKVFDKFKQSKTLRQEAEQEWQVAKEQFEKALLGE